MNPDLQRLQPYPFEKLRALLADVRPAEKPHIALSIGEPKHATPDFVADTLMHNLEALSNYPLTRGLPELREAIAGWLQQRFTLPRPVDPESEVLPVNGTREALFAFAQAIIDRSASPLVISPNPFYQIYEGAALLAGAKPHYLPCTAETDYLPDIENVTPETWERCQLVYVCSPGNPTGAVLSEGDWQRLIELADRHDFIIAADECYSELYFEEDAPPVGLLQAAARMGHTNFRRCVVFHSLSKRSNAPGLRSGFVAGDRNILADFLRYRTYHGCAMPLPAQYASIAAWSDESHVRRNRELYRAKFEMALEILRPVMAVDRPDAGFYLWAKVPGGDDEAFARGLFERQHVTVLPGSYLSREVDGLNPGRGHVRMALVASPEECAEAAQRIKSHIEGL